MEGPYPQIVRNVGLKGKQGSGTGDIPRNALDTGKFGHSIILALQRDYKYR